MLGVITWALPESKALLLGLWTLWILLVIGFLVAIEYIKHSFENGAEVAALDDAELRELALVGPPVVTRSCPPQRTRISTTVPYTPVVPPRRMRLMRRLHRTHRPAAPRQTPCSPNGSSPSRTRRPYPETATETETGAGYGNPASDRMPGRPPSRPDAEQTEEDLTDEDPLTDEDEHRTAEGEDRALRDILHLTARDVRHATQNVMACIVLFGLVVIPSLFTWFNVIASWDPFANTKDLKIAVASTDGRYESDLVRSA